jgi:hypothetical protein
MQWSWRDDLIKRGSHLGRVMGPLNAQSLSHAGCARRFVCQVDVQPEQGGRQVLSLPLLIWVPHSVHLDQVHAQNRASAFIEKLPGKGAVSPTILAALDRRTPTPSYVVEALWPTVSNTVGETTHFPGSFAVAMYPMRSPD